jgi:hypothetical protein
MSCVACERGLKLSPLSNGWRGAESLAQRASSAGDVFSRALDCRHPVVMLSFTLFQRCLRFLTDFRHYLAPTKTALKWPCLAPFAVPHFDERKVAGNQDLAAGSGGGSASKSR